MYMNHLVAAFALFVLALLGGLLPLAMREVLCMSEVGRAALLSVGACFSGGLLVGASLLHLLPEATELDAIVAGRHGLRRLHGGDERPFPASFLLCASALLCLIAAELGLASCGCGGGRPRQAHESDEEEPSDEEDCEAGHRRPSYLVGVGSATSSVSALATVAAFGLHASFEGIAMGVVADARSMMLAVGAHKAFAAFALGTSVSRARVGGRPIAAARASAVIVTFALLTPGGILFGRQIAAAADPDGCGVCPRTPDACRAPSLLHLFRAGRCPRPSRRSRQALFCTWALSRSSPMSLLTTSTAPRAAGPSPCQRCAQPFAASARWPCSQHTCEMSRVFRSGTSASGSCLRFVCSLCELF